MKGWLMFWTMLSIPTVTNGLQHKSLLGVKERQQDSNCVFANSM
jgi:hypothetical protein